MTDNETSNDNQRKVYAFIADAHLNFTGSDETVFGLFPPIYGNGVELERYMINIMKRLKKLDDEKIISETIILGDFFDNLQSQGINRLAYNPPTNECKDGRVLQEHKLYSEIIDNLRLTKDDNSQYFKFVIGNHDSEQHLVDEKIRFEDVYETKDFAAIHGYQYDQLLRVLQLLPKGIFNRSLVQKLPDKSEKLKHMLSYNSKIISGIIGGFSVSMYHAWLNLTKKVNLNLNEYEFEGAETYGLGYRNAETYHLIRRAKKDFDKFMIIAHRHDKNLQENGVVIPEVYESGLSFMIDTPETFEFILGVKGPKSVEDYGHTYNKFFELAHKWDYSKKEKKWEYKGKIYDDLSLENILRGSEFTSYEGVKQDGPSQKVQDTFQTIYQKLS